MGKQRNIQLRSVSVLTRRNDCRIMFVDESEVKAIDETRINTYKASNKMLKMSEVVDAKEPETPTPPAAPVENEQKDETIPNQEKLIAYCRSTERYGGLGAESQRA